MSTYEEFMVLLVRYRIGFLVKHIIDQIFHIVKHKKAAPVPPGTAGHYTDGCQYNSPLDKTYYTIDAPVCTSVFFIPILQTGA